MEFLFSDTPKMYKSQDMSQSKIFVFMIFPDICKKMATNMQHVTRQRHFGPSLIMSRQRQRQVQLRRTHPRIFRVISIVHCSMVSSVATIMRHVTRQRHFGPGLNVSRQRQVQLIHAHPGIFRVISRVYC